MKRTSKKKKKIADYNYKANTTNNKWAVTITTIKLLKTSCQIQESGTSVLRCSITWSSGHGSTWGPAGIVLLWRQDYISRGSAQRFLYQRENEKQLFETI